MNDATGLGPTARVAAMFPLGRAMLPGAVLSLHVFEPRYRQMMEELVGADPPEFGVVLIARGSEVGGGDQRTVVGSVARLLEVARTPDGRYACVAGMMRRLRVVQWLDDDPYPRALVEDWPEADGPVDAGLLASVASRVRAAAALAIELGDRIDAGGPTQRISDDPELGVYQLCSMAPLGDADRQHLLETPGPALRLQRLADMLGDLEAVLAFRLGE